MAVDPDKIADWRYATSVAACRGMDLISYATQIRDRLDDGRFVDFYLGQMREAVLDAEQAVAALEAEVRRRKPSVAETMIGDRDSEAAGAMPETNPAPGKEGKNE